MMDSALALIPLENSSSQIINDSISDTISKRYGCNLININELRIPNNIQIELSILNDENNNIEQSKILDVLILCDRRDDESNESREQVLKEYLILSMTNANTLLQEGRICSFINSSIRSIVHNFMTAKGLKYLTLDDDSLDDEKKKSK